MTVFLLQHFYFFHFILFLNVAYVRLNLRVLASLVQTGQAALSLVTLTAGGRAL
jgi:hypothetical protein